MITSNRMTLRCSFEKVEEISHGTNLIVGKCLDREVTSNNQDNGRVEVVRQESVVHQHGCLADTRNPNSRCFDTPDKGIYCDADGK